MTTRLCVILIEWSNSLSEVNLLTFSIDSLNSSKTWKTMTVTRVIWVTVNKPCKASVRSSLSAYTDERNISKSLFLDAIRINERISSNLYKAERQVRHGNYSSYSNLTMTAKTHLSNVMTSARVCQTSLKIPPQCKMTVYVLTNITEQGFRTPDKSNHPAD